MVKAKHRFYVKWRHTALSVGFLTIILVASALAQGSEYIYWTDLGTSKIRRANLDGTNPVDHITGVNYGSGIALDLNQKADETQLEVPALVDDSDDGAVDDGTDFEMAGADDDNETSTDTSVLLFDDEDDADEE